MHGRGPSGILNADAIPSQLVDGTADRAVLVLYSPGVTSIDCAWIVMGLLIAMGLSGL